MGSFDRYYSKHKKALKSSIKKNVLFMLHITVQEMFAFFFVCTFISISPLNEAVYSSLSVHGSLSLLGFTVFCYSRNQQVFYSAVLN